MIYTIITIVLLALAALFFLFNFLSGGYLIGVIRWRFGRKKWKGRRIYIMGKMRTVTAESYEYIFVKGLSHEIRKDNRYLRINGSK